MNIINKLLLLLSLLMTPAVAVSAQEADNTFDTYQTADKYLEDFSYLREYDYRLSYCINDEVDYSGEGYVYYAFPIYYDIVECYNRTNLYYTNNEYQFYYFTSVGTEIILDIYCSNYIGGEAEMPFLALNYIGMSQVIDHDTIIESNDITIYNSFYNFFTGFFPENVVAEYHGIFTFIVVAFLLFLVFGFV
ncbi:MAG TPA: hypothetical protein VJZ99_00040, partial [Patescibacteria group bacterium]|nr:hypothetical protein [Patescibacteria group bacterium]